MTTPRTILDLIEDDIYHHTTGAEDPREVCMICGGRIEWRPVVYTTDGPVHDRHDTDRIVAKLAEVTRDAWTGDSVVTILGTERARIITHVRVGTVSETVDGDDWIPTALALWAEVPA